jgi:hypothetical protein
MFQNSLQHIGNNRITGHSAADRRQQLIRADGTITEGVRQVAGESVAVGAAGTVDGLRTIGGAVRSVRYLGEVGKNFKMNKTKGAPSFDEGASVKGEVSTQPTTDSNP